jgi:16S rRNA (adenine1518-N6/adenine1519-N6)-dimethyltransferase
MTVTIQKELADRILSGPGTKNYGALSIWMQSQCRVSLVRVLPPNVFWPRPKVDSAIIHIEVDSSLRDRIEDLNFFHQFVRSMFFHRRKFLRSVLISAMKGNLDKPAVDEIMNELGLAADSRAEQLDVERMLELSRAVQARLES